MTQITPPTPIQKSDQKSTEYSHSPSVVKPESPVDEVPPTNDSFKNPPADLPSKTGRISNDSHGALQEGFSQLDGILTELSARTGLSIPQILSLWDKRRPRPQHAIKSLWNAYQKYFRANRADELARVGLTIDSLKNIPGESQSECAMFTIT